MSLQHRLVVWPSSASNRFRYKHSRVRNSRNRYLELFIKVTVSMMTVLVSGLSITKVQLKMLHFLWMFYRYFLKILPIYSFFLSCWQLWTPEHAQTCRNTPPNLSNPCQTSSSLHSINHCGCHTSQQGRAEGYTVEVWECVLSETAVYEFISASSTVTLIRDLRMW